MSKPIPKVVIELPDDDLRTANVRFTSWEGEDLHVCVTVTPNLPEQDGTIKFCGIDDTAEQNKYRNLGYAEGYKRGLQDCGVKDALSLIGPTMFVKRWDAAAGRETDTTVAPAYLHWLQTQARREGVGGNEAWNAGVAWVLSRLVNPSQGMLEAAQRADMDHSPHEEWRHDEWPDHLRVLRALIESASDLGTPEVIPTVVHNRTGGVYTHLGSGYLQTDRPLEDMAVIEFYKGTDGRLWARASAEFKDRFTQL